MALLMCRRHHLVNENSRPAFVKGIDSICIQVGAPMQELGGCFLPQVSNERISLA